MNDLLNLTVKAHGGAERWSRISTITTRLSASGAVWTVKGHGDLFADVTVVADAHRQYLTGTPFKKPDQRSVFEGTRTAVETLDGAVIEERLDPRAHFAGATAVTPWDDLDAVYFGGEALWTYLTVPFVIAERALETEELEPWTEQGEQWRRLRVLFPENIETHSREQVFYIDADGMIRRHDYTAEVVGGGPAAHYPSEFKVFDEIVFPTRRLVHARSPQNERVAQPVLIDIAFRSFTLA